MNVLRRSGASSPQAGRAEVQIGPVPPWQAWTIDRVAVAATAGDPEARIYVGSISDATMVAGTYSGRLDAYDAAQPLHLPEGVALFVVWTGAEPGSVCTATATGRLLAAV